MICPRNETLPKIADPRTSIERSRIYFCEAWTLVEGFFEGDKDKTREWFFNKNSHLGGLTPADMVKSGHVRKLLRWLKPIVEEFGRNEDDD